MQVMCNDLIIISLFVILFISEIYVGYCIYKGLMQEDLSFNYPVLFRCAW